jgi:N-methylhydantoinase A
VDVKSVGAGGGSIAWVDAGGVLHVGPQSAGASPGPACYGRQFEFATVTDAALVLGFIDPDYFLGGAIALDRNFSRDVIARTVAGPLACSVEAAAAAVIEVATENMAQAIIDISVDQGLDPGRAVLVGGGGAAGLNSIYIARRLSCPTLVIPDLGAALSAAGGLLSEVAVEYRTSCFLRSEAFDEPGAQDALESLRARAVAFMTGVEAEGRAPSLSFSAEVRYPRQAWEIQIPLRGEALDPAGLAGLIEDFHAGHERIYAVNDPESPVEVIGLAVRAGLGGREAALGALKLPSGDAAPIRRQVWLPGEGEVSAEVHRAADLPRGVVRRGPAIVESPFTSVVLDSGCRFQLSASGALVIDVSAVAAESEVVS